MEEVIKSTQNPLIKDVKSLHRKKYRDMTNRYFVEGSKIVDEALNGDESIDFTVISQDYLPLGIHLIERVKSKGVKIFIVNSKLYREISDTENPQGIMAVIQKKVNTLDDILKASDFFLTVLDQIQDPGNMGTIIRTLDAVGGDGVILLKGCADPYNPKVLRSTMGSIFRVPIIENKDFEELFNSLKEINAHVVVSSLDGSSLFNWTGGFRKTVLVIGNESQGVRKDIYNYASSLIKIPIWGGAESLNASVAAGILIYEILRKDKNRDR